MPRVPDKQVYQILRRFRVSCNLSVHLPNLPFWIDVIVRSLPFQGADEPGDPRVRYSHVQLAGVDDYPVVSVQQLLHPRLHRLMEILPHVAEHSRVEILVDCVPHMDGMSDIIPLDVLLVKPIRFGSLLLQKVLVEVESGHVFEVGGIRSEVAV